MLWGVGIKKLREEALLDGVDAAEVEPGRKGRQGEVGRGLDDGTRVGQSLRVPHGCLNEVG